MAMIKNRKSVLLTLLTIVLFVLMLGELFTYAVIDINFSQISQQSALLIGSGSFAQTVNTGIQNFLQTSLDGALSAYYSSSCSSNFTATLKSLIVNGVAGPSCTKTSNSLSGSTLQTYINALQNQAKQQQVTLTISNAIFNVYQSSPTSVIAAYTAYVTINTSSGSFAYPLNLKAAAQTSLGVASIPITLTNSQSSAMSANTQVQISFQPLQYFIYEKSNLGNIRFYYNKTELYSWCESNCQSSSTSSAVFWVKVPASIGSGNSITINMYMLQQSIDYDGTYAGEAPELSSTYAQYDNGNVVFNFYENFAGSSLGSLSNSWTQEASVTATVNNGIQLSTTASGTFAGVYTSSYNVPANTIIDAYLNTAGEYSSTGVGTGGGSDVGYIMGEIRYPDASPDWGLQASINGDYETYGGSISSAANTWYILSVPYITSTALYVNYANILASGFTITPTAGALHLATWAVGTTPVTYQWVRGRAYPPNNVMPTVTFGSLISI
jgi:hypothetical protein